MIDLILANPIPLAIALVAASIALKEAMTRHALQPARVRQRPSHRANEALDRAGTWKRSA